MRDAGDCSPVWLGSGNRHAGPRLDFIESSVDGLVDASRKIEKLSREVCRKEFERRFTVETMVDRYETGLSTSDWSNADGLEGRRK